MGETMKALTLTQPWATLMAVGAKRVETRSWSTNYRGPLVIHAAKGCPRACRDLFVGVPEHSPFAQALQRAGLPHTSRSRPPTTWIHHGDPRLSFPLPSGEVVAVVDLVDCIPTTELVAHRTVSRNGYFWNLTPEEEVFGEYAPGRFAWLTANILRIEPGISARGYQQLWTLPPMVETKLAEAVGRLLQGV